MSNTLLHHKIALQYARVLFQQAQESLCLEPVVADIQAISHLFEQVTELATWLNNPSVPASERKSFLVEQLDSDKFNSLTRRLLVLMEEQGRLGLLPDFCSAFLALWDELRRVATAEVTTAVPVPDELAERLAERVAQAYGYDKVHLRCQVDPAVLGGVILRFQDQLLDGSFSGRLDRLLSRYTAN
ncbi:MAG: ATP synthase F1 subunit delta [Candidatus Melainabacteria bacterium]|nr:ATP synthase F1 subunit delta [Candidatus Melainabacteria bacterium]